MLKVDINRYKNSEFLTVSVPLFPKDKVGFCIPEPGNVELYLVANGDKPIFGWNPYSVRLSVLDGDDYESEKLYQFTEDTFQEKLRELINWMNDMNEAEIDNCSVPFDDLFFP